MGLIRDMIEAHAGKKDDLISSWYWRRKYNSLKIELDQVKEVMQSDIYNRIVKELTDPLELRRYKRENTRLRNKCNVIIEERNTFYDELQILKKGRSGHNGS